MKLKFYLLVLFIIVLAPIAYFLNFGRKPTTNITGLAEIQVDIQSVDTIDRLPWLKSASSSNTLHFKHGLKLTSSNKSFGGISGLYLSKERNALLAIADTGNWLKAETVWSNGIVTTLNNVVLAPIKYTSGDTLRKRGHGDVEALAHSSTQTFIADESWGSTIFSASNVFDNLLTPVAEYLTHGDMKKLPKGRGVEAMAILDLPARPKQLFVIAERNSETESRLIPSWLVPIEGSNRVALPLTYEPTPGFDVSDAAFSKRCGLLLLERRLSWFGYFEVRLKLIDTLPIQSNQTIRGKTILAANSLGSNIDNMEGLSIVDGPSGSCDVFLISDNNFLSFQSTLLLQFELLPISQKANRPIH